MDLDEFRKRHILERLEMYPANFGRVISFVDFGNVNHWFEDDRQDHLHNALADNTKFGINLHKLKAFTDLFSIDTRFYYGHDAQNQGSLDFIRIARDTFGKHRVITKQMQRVRHYLSVKELSINTRKILADADGNYIKIPKCNFDVEIAVDAIRLIETYDTICLFSGDADFVNLLRYIKKKVKAVILIKGGHITHDLKEISDVIINAQNIKEYITDIKQKPGV